jgi:hypothetical protein
VKVEEVLVEPDVPLHPLLEPVHGCLGHVTQILLQSKRLNKYKFKLYYINHLLYVPSIA